MSISDDRARADGDLLALRGPWLASLKAFDEAVKALDEAETRAPRNEPPLDGDRS